MLLRSASYGSTGRLGEEAVGTPTDVARDTLPHVPVAIMKLRLF